MNLPASSHNHYHVKPTSRVTKEKHHAKAFPPPRTDVIAPRDYKRAHHPEWAPKTRKDPPIRMSLPTRHTDAAQPTDTGEITVLSSRYASLDASRRRASVSYPQHRQRVHDSDHYAVPTRDSTSPRLLQPEPRHIYPNPARPRFLSSPSVASDILVLPPAPDKALAARPSIASDIVILPPAAPPPQVMPDLNLTGVAAYVPPDHIFVTLEGDHILRISPLAAPARLRRVRDAVVPLWPKGIEYDRERREGCEISFGGEIWSAGGSNGIAAKRLLAQLFSSLALEGYSFACSVQASHPNNPPRMLFTSISPQKIHFFAMSFSMNHTKLTMIDAPSAIPTAISNALKLSPPLKVDDKARKGLEGKERSLYVLQIKARVVLPTTRSSFRKFIKAGGGSDTLSLLGQMLKVTASYGYKLEASIPMGRTGVLGARGNREVWILRRVG